MCIVNAESAHSIFVEEAINILSEEDYIRKIGGGFIEL